MWLSLAFMRQPLVHNTPVFYGWVIAGIGTFSLIMTSPGQSYVVSIFIEYFIADLGISRSIVSTLYTAATLAGSFALPFVGRLIDGYGPRRMVTGIALLFGVACLGMGMIQNVIMLGLGFFAIRLLGQGSLGLAGIYVINQWWIRRRGLVMGLSGFFVAILGLGMFPVVTNELIQLLGWRATYFTLGLLLLFVMAPLGYVFFRDKPEQFGLAPDGASAQFDEASGVASPLEENWELHEAIRTRSFWVVAGSAGTLSMLTTGLVFHLVGMFADSGLDADTAARVFVPMAITMALINLIGGVWIDRLSVRVIMILALLCMAGTLLLATRLHAPWLVLLYGIGMGSVSGFYRVIMSVVWATYFGRLHLGRITGVAQTIAIGGSALGPMPFGLARDLSGTYTTILLWCIALPLGFALANVLVGKPVRHQNTGSK